MANMNTFNGFQNLPGVVGTSYTTESGYVIPSAGTYPGLPSPTQIAANWLVVPALPGDTTPGGALDYGRPFTVKVNGTITSANSENITVKIYQCTAAKFTAGVTATGNGTQIATTGTMATGGALKFSFFLECVCHWDSISKTLGGYYYGHHNAGTPATIGPTTFTNNITGLAENDLNFFFTLTAGTGTSDTLGPLDFTVERF
jgi:hypothetical protein